MGGRGGEHIPVAEGNVWVEVEVEVQANRRVSCRGGVCSRGMRRKYVRKYQSGGGSGLAPTYR